MPARCSVRGLRWTDDSRREEEEGDPERGRRRAADRGQVGLRHGQHDACDDRARARPRDLAPLRVDALPHAPPADERQRERCDQQSEADGAELEEDAEERVLHRLRDEQVRAVDERLVLRAEPVAGDRPREPLVGRRLPGLEPPAREEERSFLVGLDPRAGKPELALERQLVVQVVGPELLRPAERVV